MIDKLHQLSTSILGTLAVLVIVFILPLVLSLEGEIADLRAEVADWQEVDNAARSQEALASARIAELETSNSKLRESLLNIERGQTCVDADVWVFGAEPIGGPDNSVLGAVPILWCVNGDIQFKMPGGNNRSLVP